MAPVTLTRRLPLDSTATEEERLFGMALKYYEEGNDIRAQGLCRVVVKNRGRLADEAREYLQLIGERADELPFVAGVYLFERGYYVAALGHFQKVVMLGRRRKDEALEYMERAAAHIGDLMRGESFVVNLATARVLGPRNANLGWPRRPARARGGEKLVTFDKSTFPFFSSAIDKEAAKQPEMPPAPARETLVRRTPHMNLGRVDLREDPAIQPGERFSVFIYTDNAPPQPGEDSSEVEFEAPPDVDLFRLHVQLLVSAHFIIEDEPAKTLVINRDEAASDWLEFKLAARMEGELAALDLAGENAAITAAFSFGGRPGGKVSREVPFAWPPDRKEHPPASARDRDKAEMLPDGPGLQYDPYAEPADLNIRIIHEAGANDRSFRCSVQTPLLPDFANEIWGPWVLPDEAPNLVRNYFEAFTSTEAGNEYRLAALLGAGEDLFEVAPQIFKTAFRRLIESGTTLRTISLVSEEPYIPWELMIPTLNYQHGDASYREPLKPLGVEYIFARWTARGSKAARQKIPMRDCHVIAPKYTDKEALKRAQDEAMFVLGKLPAASLIDPASFANIIKSFGAGAKSVIHFACHGENPKDEAQMIHLTSKPPLRPFILRGQQTIKRSVAQREPFVFINACEVGHPAPALAGVGGFAETFIKMGARAVLAPLWSVSDEIAYKVACEFYKRVMREPETPLAEIVRHIRAKAYDETEGEDSYAAYCFYGDPLGKRVT